MQFLDFQHLKNKEVITSLFADYSSASGDIDRYFNGNIRSPEDWKRIMDSVKQKNFDRSGIQRILNDQNRSFHSGIKTLANIDLLGNENTFAIVTGQQLGLFSGPLYTVYKAITAVKLAEHLTEKYPDYNFVPIFWLEAEDHDFEEINAVNILSASNELSSISYLPDGKPIDRNMGPSGMVTISDGIDQTLAELAARLPVTEYTEGILQELKGYYKKGNSLVQAFTGIFNHFYENSGLVFLNPNDAEVKKFLGTIFKQEFLSNNETSHRIIQRSADLEEQYFAQVKPKSINLFMIHKGGRFSLEPSEQDYYLKNTRQRFTREELETLLDQSPEVFSPNVILRPICQDFLLPTIAYIAGPSEIAYFAQLKPVYEYYNITMPLIYPRASVTIVEEKIQKVLEKYSLDLLDFFGESDAVLNKVSEQVSEVKVEELFSQMESRIKETIQEGRFGIQQIDQTLSGTVDTMIAKIDQQLEVLKQKTKKAQQLKEEISLKQIRKAILNIFPRNNFQERELCVVQYLNKYGPDFITWISHEISIDSYHHQIISI